MPLIKWLLWRRWLFKRWIKGSKPEPLINNLLKTNFGSCRHFPIIYRDMVRLISKEQGRGHQ